MNDNKLYVEIISPFAKSTLNSASAVKSSLKLNKRLVYVTHPSHVRNKSDQVVYILGLDSLNYLSHAFTSKGRTVTSVQKLLLAEPGVF